MMDAREAIAAMRANLDAMEASLGPTPIKEAFSKEGLRQTLNLSDFTTRPKMAPRKAEPLKDKPVPPLDDPSFMLRAGYVSAAIGGGMTSAGYRPWLPYIGFSNINDELAAYPNQDAIDASGLDPITVEDGCLVLTAQKTTEAYRKLLPERYPSEYTSGAINTFPFAQCYGIFEMEAQLPDGRGLWPAFWLLPADNTWPPEIDVMEVLMHEANRVYHSLHFHKNGKNGAKGGVQGKWTSADLTTGFHRFSLRWTKELMEWSVDGDITFSTPTPPQFHRPFYLLANLAVGGNWPGPPDANTVFPAKMKIRSIKAWSL